MRHPHRSVLALLCLYGTKLSAAGFSATGVEQRFLSGLESYLSQSRFPLRTLHPKAEVAYAQVTDARGPAFADLKQIGMRLEDVSGNGHFGFYLEAAYAGSRQDVRTSLVPLSTSPLDVTSLGGGAFLELPILARVGLYGEYGYIYNKLSVTPPAGDSLVPDRDSHAQGRYGVRLFLTDADALSYGRITGTGAYLAPLENEFSWRHAFAGTSSLSLRHKTGPAVKAWEVAFGLGF
jgi:hypothetical protein